MFCGSLLLLRVGHFKLQTTANELYVVAGWCAVGVLLYWFM